MRSSRGNSRRSKRAAAGLLLGLFICAAWGRPGHASEPTAFSDADRGEDPAIPHALGRVFASGTLGSDALFLLSSGGYGYRGETIGSGDSQHTLGGSIAVEKRMAPWLGFGLRFDGRYELHLLPNGGSDDGLVGDPRVFIRVDRTWTGALRAGARLGIWIPGRNAPSIFPTAITPELVGAVTYLAATVPLSVSANLGFRLDRSARSAADAPFISASDRMALEVSDFDQALFGLCATFGRGRVQGFTEVSEDLLVGRGSPGASVSPLRIGGGARISLRPQIHLEMSGELSPSARPDLSPQAPLVPVPPRVAFWLGLAYRFDTRPPGRSPPPAPPDSAVPVSVQLEGRVVAGDLATLTGLEVELEAGSGRIEPLPAADGTFAITGTVGRKLTIRARAAGYRTAIASIVVAAASHQTILLTLERDLPSGQLRGLVRSLAGKPIDAEITIEPGRQTLRAQEGRFEVDVAPGSYAATIAAPGYAAQTRQVHVEKNGVILLNIDLKAQR